MVCENLFMFTKVELLRCGLREIEAKALGKKKLSTNLDKTSQNIYFYFYKVFNNRHVKAAAQHLSKPRSEEEDACPPDTHMGPPPSHSGHCSRSIS